MCSALCYALFYNLDKPVAILVKSVNLQLLWPQLRPYHNVASLCANETVVHDVYAYNNIIKMELSAFT